ncbi:MAG: glycoside hydrolase family 38 C-terminal domain-containing protein, partial [Bacteroidota bacterium]|nr:glycoside hydrolase family 38 C-terminal domain-containing protein [Bacteroidota bacterium]
MKLLRILIILSISAVFSLRVNAQPLIGKPLYDFTQEPVLYTVGYAHLDSQWRWDYPATINRFIKATLDDNFMYFERYKDYVFNFSGARRYRLMKEYYPAKYELLKKYISQGRWFVAGSSVDECDANIPSPESILRQILYGNGYFRNEFGKESVDFLLPDCFGFQADLPSVLAHAGLKGFSTQKLGWGSAVGIPFNIGNWIGPDGKGIVAALNPTSYTSDIDPRLDTAKYWIDRINDNGKKYGIYADYRYYGTGDIGGAPSEKAIKNGVGSMNNPDSKIHVYLSSADQFFRDLTDAQKAQLPSYSGDLLLTQHSAGSLTSQSYMKRWNRKNELLAQAAEPLAITADWLGSQEYPLDNMNQAWWLVLQSQMHDMLPGTCIPTAYEYAWNDEVLALNRFSSVLRSAAGSVCRALDTRGQGKSIVVYNPVAIDRQDVAEADIQFPEGVPDAVLVTGPDGKETPCQITGHSKTSLHLLFIAHIPSMGLACYDVRPVKHEPTFRTGVSGTGNTLENEYYKVTLNANGDISGITDKKLNKELLSAPIRMEFHKEHPEYWPAWNMDWKDRKEPPIGFVDGNVKMTFTENGPVRTSIQVERTGMNSVFHQTISLSAGETGQRIEFRNNVEWQSKGVSLRAAFPLTASNSAATYNLGLGTIERENNNEKKYEVPSREWFDLTDKSGTYGVSVLEDCKFASDKPNDKTLRLTLLYTPQTNVYHDQGTQDWGIHEFTYALYSHKGDWRTGQSEWQGRFLNQPLKAFQVTAHEGSLGKSFSLVSVNTPEVDIRAVKKAENGNGIIIRLQELFGKDVSRVEVTFPAKILSASETDGQERVLGNIPASGNKMVVDMKKFGIRSFNIKLDNPENKLTPSVSYPLNLTYDQNVTYQESNKKNGKFDESGMALPAELLPGSITMDGIRFTLGKTTDGQNNVLTCKGQKILLPKTGHFNRIYILAAAVNDTNGQFRAGNNKKSFRISKWTGKIGSFDLRKWDKFERITGLEPGFIKRDEVACFITHLCKDTLNIPYQYAYIFKYGMDVAPTAAYIQLPENEGIKIFAITAADDPYAQIETLQPLYDDFSGRKALSLVLEKRTITEDMVPIATCTKFQS